MPAAQGPTVSTPLAVNLLRNLHKLCSILRVSLRSGIAPGGAEFSYFPCDLATSGRMGTARRILHMARSSFHQSVCKHSRPGEMPWVARRAPPPGGAVPSRSEPKRLRWPWLVPVSTAWVPALFHFGVCLGLSGGLYVMASCGGSVLHSCWGAAAVGLMSAQAVSGLQSAQTRLHSL